jgi:thiol-disulfide isomerase/thioredoxin
MASSRFTMRVLAALTLWAGFGLSARAQLPAISVDKAFEAKPRQPGVMVATPSPDQIGKYRVDAIPNTKAPGSNIGYVLRDPENKPVRQFISYDNKQFNIVAFYANGQEVYREVYPPAPNEPYQFRWLGQNGGKWGLDRDRDGKIDEWVVISPEEVSQELLQAVITRDSRRLDALLATRENLEALGLSPAETARIKEKTAGAGKRLSDAVAALNLSPEAKWIHLELGVPQTTPADAFGGRADHVVHKNGTILIEDKGKTHFLQTGELLMVGGAWKVVEGPVAGPGGPTSGPGEVAGPVITDDTVALVKQLDALDKIAPNPPVQPALGEYYGKRAAILEQIVQKLPPEKQADWVRMLVDSLAAAAESGKADNPAHQRLKQLKESLVKVPQNPLGAYAAFRLLAADHGIASAAVTGGKDFETVQEKWRLGLEEFVKTYPTAEDTGDAVFRLAIANEALKDGEPKAKEWYAHLAKTYPQHPSAAKAAGAIKRLDSEGKPFDLQGTILATGQTFTPGQVAGKVVVVYYWASWSTLLGEDAKKLKDLVSTYGPKGLEVVTICLDDDPKVAAQSIAALQLPGTHLHMKGGQDGSPLASAYGINVVPHIFVVAKDGKVVNKNGQINLLADEVKKLVQ